MIATYMYGLKTPDMLGVIKECQVVKYGISRTDYSRLTKKNQIINDLYNYNWL